MRASERMRASGSLRHGSRPWPMLLSPARTAGTPTSSRPTSRESGAGARRARRCSRSPNRPHRRPRDRPRLRAARPRPRGLLVPHPHRRSSLRVPAWTSPPSSARSSSIARPADTATGWRRNWRASKADAPPAVASSPSPYTLRHRFRPAHRSQSVPGATAAGESPGRLPPVAGDSGWWELDSSEAIPAPPREPEVAGPLPPSRRFPPASGWHDIRIARIRSRASNPALQAASSRVGHSCGHRRGSPARGCCNRHHLHARLPDLCSRVGAAGCRSTGTRVERRTARIGRRHLRPELPIGPRAATNRGGTTPRSRRCPHPGLQRDR